MKENVEETKGEQEDSYKDKPKFNRDKNFKKGKFPKRGEERNDRVEEQEDAGMTLEEYLAK